MDVLEDLKQKAHAVQWGTGKRKEQFALVAKGGFTNQLIKTAKKEGIVLIKEDRVKG